MAHPVGTGPYMLKSGRARAKIVLEANPDYRGFTWDFQPTSDPAWDDALVKAMRGKQMPQIGRVEIRSSRKTSRAGSRSTRRSSTTSTLPATFRPQVFDADNS